jgi:dynein heavy chain
MSFVLLIKIVEKVSKTARSMCYWVVAINRYAEVFKDIEPKIRKRDAAEKEMRQVMYVLKQKQSQLADVEGKMELLKNDLDRKQKEMHEIQLRYDLNSKRLTSAGRLTEALSDEEVRWRETVAKLDNDLYTVPGDILVASAFIAYLGAFPIHYRNEISKKWIAECRRLKIPSGDNFDFMMMGDPYQMRSWNIHGLPRDEISMQNGIIATQSNRFPLIIDPQEQANRWIRNMESANHLAITKMTDTNLTRIIEQAVVNGTVVLIEEVGETIDPSLNSILVRQFFTQGGRTLLKFGDNELEYNTSFKLYMTTKLSNPHYLPEVCIQVTLINFLVSMTSLEDQLLAEIVRIELPEMEKQRNDLIVSINSDKQQLQMLEDRILKLLFSSEGNILDDEELVETLNESKETSIVIASRLVDTEKTEETITIEREKYRPLAAKGAVLYFVASSLAEIDSMYQVSLRYFTQIFCHVIAEPAPKMAYDERIRYLLKKELRAIYLNICRGLFERHKLIYSFLLATAMQKHDGKLENDDLEFLLRGIVKVNENPAPKPSHLGKISEKQWQYCAYLQSEVFDFEHLDVDLDKCIEIYIKDQKFTLSSGDGKLSFNWNNKLTSFEKLMLISVLKPEELMMAISSYINEILGRDFIENKTTTLSQVYDDMQPSIPLIFILSSGSDPLTSLQKFANEKEFSEKLHCISLGQGQGAAAEVLINKAKTVGHWVYLQNCHLAVSWLPRLEMIVRDLVFGNVHPHRDFRLFLSSKPLQTFPVSVLQNSVKLTNEAPKSLKANLMKSLVELNQETFEIHVLDDSWRKMIFGLCMFHGIIQERKKFGSLGFNISYEFNESDRECALNTLDIYIDREVRQEIPWQALEYINAEITYGGRVTDEWDQRCVRSILKIFLNERILNENYKYSASGIYKCPDSKFLNDFKQYVSTLPYKEETEVFGMHENANIVYETNEANFFLQTIFESQNKSSKDATGSANDQIVLNMIDKIKSNVKKLISLDNFKPKVDAKDRVLPLQIVLVQETERFNKLLELMHSTLNELEKAIKGLVVMSESLELIFESFLANQVPVLWMQSAFLSTKSLASWIDDLCMRVEHIQVKFVNNVLKL